MWLATFLRPSRPQRAVDSLCSVAKPGLKWDVFVLVDRLHTKRDALHVYSFRQDHETEGMRELALILMVHKLAERPWWGVDSHGKVARVVNSLKPGL